MTSDTITVHNDSEFVIAACDFCSAPGRVYATWDGLLWCSACLRRKAAEAEGADMGDVE